MLATQRQWRLLEPVVRPAGVAAVLGHAEFSGAIWGPPGSPRTKQLATQRARVGVPFIVLNCVIGRWWRGTSIGAGEMLLRDVVIPTVPRGERPRVHTHGPRPAARHRAAQLRCPLAGFRCRA